MAIIISKRVLVLLFFFNYYFLYFQFKSTTPVFIFKEKSASNDKYEEKTAGLRSKQNLHMYCFYFNIEEI